MKLHRGAALIPALLIVSIVAALAAAFATRLDAALQWAIYRRDEIAARELALAAIDYARSVLWEDARVSLVDAPNEIWATAIGALPVEGGQVSGAIRDGQGLFNLNNLVDADAESAPDVAAFDRLAAMVGAGCVRGATLAKILRQRPRRAFTDADELADLPELAPGCADRLREHVVALPERTPLNVNTASAQVLSAYLPGTGTDAVEAALGAPRRVFASPGEFTRLFAAPAGRFSTDSRYFLAAGQARQGRASISVRALLSRSGRRWPRLIYVRIAP